MTVTRPHKRKRSPPKPKRETLSAEEIAKLDAEMDGLVAEADRNFAQDEGGDDVDEYTRHFE